MSTLEWPADPSDAQVAAVLALADAATDTDGMAPFSEATTLGLRRLPQHGAAAGLRLATIGHAELVGAAVLADDGSAEAAVRPDARGRGLGRRLIDALLQERPDAQLWAHGDLPAAQALARAYDLQVSRNLWRMQRAVDAEPAIRPRAAGAPDAPVVPAGFAARSFVPDQDAQAWLDLNATAFAHHPEQGRMTMDDLQDRIAQPWFDPEGLLLIEDTAVSPHRLVASHWTKVAEPDSGEGEVYVVAVDPAYQGRGLGRAVTGLGLAYLASRGLQTIDLYVEGDNGPAVATYTRLGFERTSIDVMYSRAVHPMLTP
ncbi:mycothiol synthase [Leekyejoonella antrihumi]|uniref:Mycothiol acetyltransferase n=1 Tax=Leekyejoonella antrihumi TaxID=1660198 RepID=A0A563E8Q0_9MICO|nr:mycothiol synthase [Leekyejoonella antrihumi]TWP38896.1 mycothiol synthase [Leekyejoonella antrihumi]